MAHFVGFSQIHVFQYCLLNPEQKEMPSYRQEEYSKFWGAGGISQRGLGKCTKLQVVFLALGMMEGMKE